ncbi:hypothetical protein MWH28_12235 [Natroniella sulfidigena]|uniref:hypothetical protein n=1 Tax=Natroniella sulfidigena TaxID=723921 RepID=UPI00200B79DE|nr:hypothetical protein [Natroniella sulfidigena]MCK8818125.1 hypothetical protein [Natroniella sulfidigena]
MGKRWGGHSMQLDKTRRSKKNCYRCKYLKGDNFCTSYNTEIKNMSRGNCKKFKQDKKHNANLLHKAEEISNRLKKEKVACVVSKQNQFLVRLTCYYKLDDCGYIDITYSKKKKDFLVQSNKMPKEVKGIVRTAIKGLVGRFK